MKRSTSVRQIQTLMPVRIVDFVSHFYLNSIDQQFLTLLYVVISQKQQFVFKVLTLEMIRFPFFPILSFKKKTSLKRQIDFVRGFVGQTVKFLIILKC